MYRATHDLDGTGAGGVDGRAIPSLDVVMPDGERVTVHPRGVGDRVSDLLRAIGPPLGCGLVVDGTAVPGHRRLVDVPQLRVGARLDLSPEVASDGDRAAADHLVRLAVTRGPACTSWVGVSPGRHRIGRASGSVVEVVDAEPHHGVLEVTADGSVSFTQLTGRVPVRIDDVPAGPQHPVVDGAELVIGSSVVTVRSADVSLGARPRGTIGAAPGDPWRRVVQRAPALDDDHELPPLVPPGSTPTHPMPPATGLIGAAVGIGGALAIATLLGQPMFALFALIGGVASLSTWAGGVVAARRRRRADRRRAAAELVRFEAAARAAGEANEERHRRRHPSVSATLDVHTRPFDVGATSPVWSRQSRGPADPATGGCSALEAVIGDGDLIRPLPIDQHAPSDLGGALQLIVDRAARLESVPVPIRFEPGTATALHAQRAQLHALARSIIVQLATWSGPADWRLVVVSGEADRWRWCEWLPHTVDDLGEHVGVLGPRVLEAGLAAGLAADPGSGPGDASDDGRLTLVVIDVPLSGPRVGALRRFLTGRAAALVLVDAVETVPSVCGRVLEVGGTGSARWRGAGPEAPTGLHLAGVDEATADHVARNLAPLVDPELPAGVGELPSDLSLAELEPDCTETAAILRRWRAGGRDPRPATPIGRSRDGVVEVDLVRDGPHGLIGGTTGSGKSELLRTLVVGLAARLSPDHLTFVLVDYKGGSTFDACVELPHTVGLVTDLDAGLAERALVSLEAELARRERLLRDVAAADLTDYRLREGTPPLPRIVVVVDEFAALARELPGFLGSLIGVAQRGRSLGVHLLLATQRPAGVVGDDIRANTNLRLALRLHDRADADDVVGDDLPARFPRDRPGRAAMRLGPDELIAFQSARCTAPSRRDRRRLRIEARRTRPTEQAPGTDGHTGDHVEMASVRSELSRLVGAIAEAADRAGVTAPHRPWHEPLPHLVEPNDLAALLDPVLPAPDPDAGSADVLPDQIADQIADQIVDQVVADDLAGDVIGVVDDPEQQCRRPLRWCDGSGNLALIGSLGSGTTTALLAVAAARCRTLGPDRCHLYAVDGGGDPALDRLLEIPHCGGVIRVQERERLARLLARLTAELDARTADASRERPLMLLLVDRLGALRTALGTLDDAVQLAQLDRLLGDGPAVGIVAAFSLDGTSNAVLTVPAGERWLFHLDDPATARGLGAGRPVAEGVPGRMRVASSGLEAQVVADPELDRVADRAPVPDTSIGPAPIEVLPRVVTAGALASAKRREARCARAADSDVPTELDVPAEGDVPADGDVPAEGDVTVRVLPIGLASDDLVPAGLLVPRGGHVFIGGLARTGRSTALARVASAWWSVVPGGRVVTVSEADGTLPDLACDAPVLVVVDDADRVDDRDGVLRGLVAGGHPDVTVAVAAGLDAVRSSYGHWTRDVARSRCGLIMTAASEIDGDLLGVTLPRRTLVDARPGLGWLVDGTGRRLVQVALDDPAP